MYLIKAMNNFASERSLESCLEALNASMQIANIRGKLVECFEHYTRLLEREGSGKAKQRERKPCKNIVFQKAIEDEPTHPEAI
jgi:hypothetical protein